MRVWEKFMSGIRAFRKEFVDAGDGLSFESIDARRFRYRLYWSFYENTAYDRVHSWSESFKVQENLYKYIRNIYNPAYRLGEFYKQHLLGGSLNINSPDKGRLPIETNNPRLLNTISVLWRESNMQILKDVVALRGSVEGDVFLRVVDDVEREKVMLQRLDAYSIVDLVKDEVGNVKEYVLEEERQHPEKGDLVTYREEVTRDGENVVFRTFLNGSPYSWYGQPAEWEVPYGFVPVVHIQHNNVGLKYGWSELHPSRPKIQEVDEQASLLSDYLRKYSDPVWLATGKRMSNISIDNDDESGTDREQPGRNRLKIISGFAEGTRVEPLVADMKVADTIKHIQNIQEEIERDYPELQTDIWATGATSGRALRIARERVTSKALQRRANYDDALVRAQQMAISIGGWRGYDGYEGFGLDSYDKGELQHRIGDRAIFEEDPMDKAEIRREEWETIKIAVDSGASLEGVLEQFGKEPSLFVVNTEGNPWDIFEEDDRYCIYKIDKNGNKMEESLGCHPTRERAEEQLEALYSNYNN